MKLITRVSSGALWDPEHARACCAARLGLACSVGLLEVLEALLGVVHHRGRAGPGTAQGDEAAADVSSSTARNGSWRLTRFHPLTAWLAARVASGGRGTGGGKAHVQPAGQTSPCSSVYWKLQRRNKASHTHTRRLWSDQRLNVPSLCG